MFVYGWSSDGRYWHAQTPYFAKKYRVALMDLAGHGHSGQKRRRYTMQSFGEDVCAVTEAAGAEKVILIGHSMGGAVIAEAAALMPGRVMGLIGVDTLDNIEYPLTKPELKDMMAPPEEGFQRREPAVHPPHALLPDRQGTARVGSWRISPTPRRTWP